MSLTYGKLSAAVKGPIGLPAYWGIRPLSAGTEPGTSASETKAMMPSIARRPLLISARRPFSFFSGEAFFERPNGSKSSSGTGCGMPPLLKLG